MRKSRFKQRFWTLTGHGTWSPAAVFPELNTSTTVVQLHPSSQLPWMDWGSFCLLGKGGCFLTWGEKYQEQSSESILFYFWCRGKSCPYLWVGGEDGYQPNSILLWSASRDVVNRDQIWAFHRTQPRSAVWEGLMPHARQKTQVSKHILPQSLDCGSQSDISLWVSVSSSVRQGNMAVLLP